MYCANCGAYNKNAVSQTLKQENMPVAEEKKTPPTNEVQKVAPMQIIKCETIIQIKTDKDYSMSFGKAIKSCFKKFINFRGRASRSEFWYWQLFALIAFILIFAPLMMLSESVEGSEELFGILAVISLLLIIIPSWAVSSRRIHDSGSNSALAHIFFIIIWFSSVAFAAIPEEAGVILGGIIQLGLYAFALSFYCKDGDIGDNEYGEDPKGRVKITK